MLKNLPTDIIDPPRSTALIAASKVASVHRPVHFWCIEVHVAALV
jgi:hypothetical protein